MANTANKKSRAGLTLTILMVSMLQMGGMGLAPSLASIAADMPNVPVSIVQTLTTFPAFIMVFVCLIANKMVFKYGKKTVLLIGAVSITLVGILGFLFNSSIVLLYIWAALLGVGFGTILPTTSGILAENYDEKERGSLMGIQSVFTNIGAMYLTYVGGALAAINWHLNYLVYLIALIPVILGIIFLPNDKPEIAQAEVPEEEKVTVKSLNKTTWVYGVITFLFMILYGVHSANISFFVVERELGSPAVVGTIMAICSVGGMIGGASFGYVNKVFKEYTFSVAFVLLAIGLLLTVYANSLALILVASVIVGCAISWDIPQSMVSLTNANRIVAATMACSVAHIGGQIGNFLSSLVMTNVTSVLNPTVAFRYKFTACLAIAVAVIVFFVIRSIEKKNSAAKAE